MSTSSLKAFVDILHRKVKPHQRGVHPRFKSGCRGTGWKNGAVCFATWSPWGFNHVLHRFSLFVFLHPFDSPVHPPRLRYTCGWIARVCSKVMGAGIGESGDRGGWKGGRETRARVTASNNVFSPLCVLAKGKSRGDKRVGRACHPLFLPARASLLHVGSCLLIYPPQSISSIPLVADGAQGG